MEGTRVEENASVCRVAAVKLRHGWVSVLDANLEIIGECGSSNVRGSFLPVQAIRLPSLGEQPLSDSLRTSRTQTTMLFYRDTLSDCMTKNTLSQHCTYNTPKVEQTDTRGRNVVATHKTRTCNRRVCRSKTGRGAARKAAARCRSPPLPPYFFSCRRSLLVEL